jgi:hypothetical protein
MHLLLGRKVRLEALVLAVDAMCRSMRSVVVGGFGAACCALRVSFRGSVDNARIDECS